MTAALDPRDSYLAASELELLDEVVSIGRKLERVASHAGTIDRKLLAALAEQGLFRRVFVRSQDGWSSQISAVELCLIREGLARACTAAETAFAVQGLGAFPLIQAGRPEVVEPWLARLARGEIAAGFALTEPQAGSDVASLRLAATRDGDGFRLKGEKLWISNAPDAEVYTVFARTSDGTGARGLTAFLLPRDSAGLRGERLELVAPHPIGRLILEDVFLPDDHVLGEVDHGFAVAMGTLDLFRPSVGAFATGMARAALDIALEHAGKREAFGRPIKSFQALSHRLAEIATRIQASRLLVHQAARAYDSGVRPVSQLAAMAKLFATETAQEAVDFAIQVHGAQALQSGHPLEYLYREVRGPRIYEGTSEIQREIIARRLFA